MLLGDKSQGPWAKGAWERLRARKHRGRARRTLIWHLFCHRHHSEVKVQLQQLYWLLLPASPYLCPTLFFNSRFIHCRVSVLLCKLSLIIFRKRKESDQSGPSKKKHYHRVTHINQGPSTKMWSEKPTWDSTASTLGLQPWEAVPHQVWKN